MFVLVMACAYNTFCKSELGLQLHYDCEAHSHSSYHCEAHSYATGVMLTHLNYTCEAHSHLNYATCVRIAHIKVTSVRLTHT